MIATKMILPFIDLIDESDAAYIKSKEGSKRWFKDLNKRPMRLKTGEVGKTGVIVYLELNKNSLRSRIKTQIGRVIR